MAYFIVLRKNIIFVANGPGCRTTKNEIIKTYIYEKKIVILLQFSRQTSLALETSIVILLPKRILDFEDFSYSNRF